MKHEQLTGRRSKRIRQRSVLAKVTEQVPSLPAWPSPPVAGEDVPRVVVVVPAFNEERFIASVVLTARRYSAQVIVVDDGSSDRTAHLAEGAGAIVVRQLMNGGKAAALNAGFRAAAAFGPDVVVCLDADAQHEPAEIPALIRPILAGESDVVIGSRFIGVKSDIPAWRKVGQHTLTMVTNTLSGVTVTDSQSGFRAFSWTAVQALRFHTTGLSVESEMQFLFGESGMRVSEVPITVKYLDGNKRNPVVHAMQVLDSMLSLVARRRPLLFLGLPGACMSCVGLLVSVLVVARISETGHLMVGTALLAVLLFIAGLLLGMTGVMLHSVSHFATRLHEAMVDLLRVRDKVEPLRQDDVRVN